MWCGWSGHEFLTGLPNVDEFVVLGGCIVDVETVGAVAFVEFEWDDAAGVPEVVADLLLEVEVSGVDAAEFAGSEVDEVPLLEEEANIEFGSADSDVGQ